MKVSVYQFGYEKNDFRGSELKFGIIWFWNVKRFSSVNDKVLNVVWPILTKLKLTFRLQSTNLSSRIRVTSEWKKSPDRIKSDAFHHFRFCDNKSWKYLTLLILDILHFICLLHFFCILFIFSKIENFILYNLHICCYWLYI